MRPPLVAIEATPMGARCWSRDARVTQCTAVVWVTLERVLAARKGPRTTFPHVVIDLRPGGGIYVAKSDESSGKADTPSDRAVADRRSGYFREMRSQRCPPTGGG